MLAQLLWHDFCLCYCNVTIHVNTHVYVSQNAWVPLLKMLCMQVKILKHPLIRNQMQNETSSQDQV